MKDYPTLTNSRPEFKQYPPKLNEHLENLAAPHLDSFNEMLTFGLKNVIKHMVPVHLKSKAGEKLCYWLEDLIISKPRVPFDYIDVKDRKIYPTESRQRHDTYSAACTAKMGYSINGGDNSAIDVDLGHLPIMLKSKACNLGNLSPKEMVEHGEHDSEFGGYFVVKGNEKIIRMLMMSRRNYPIVVKRSTWKDRGQGFSDIGAYIRTVRCDEIAYVNVLHFLNNGTAKFMFSQNKAMSYVPVCLILKALVDYTDEEIYTRLIRGYENDQYYKSCIQTMLREVHSEGIHSHIECKDYLGEIFRSKFWELPEWTRASEITDFILSQRVLIHLDSFEDKFNILVFMVQKLFQCVQGNFKVENVDSVMMQEVLLSGHLYQKVLTERLTTWMLYVKRNIEKRLENSGSLITAQILTASFRQVNVQRGMESFLATGNASSRSGMGLMQNNGLAIMAENINRMRYMSHFRAVHRGSYFTTMRTTEARQLLPDAWGFICPVHTPDGTPCGLLNHLTIMCKISTTPPKDKVDVIPKILVDLGMLPLESPCFDASAKLLVVFLEGKCLGNIRQVDATKIVDKLRYLKIDGTLPEMLEIAYIPPKNKGQFPGLFLFAGPARMMRPVKNLALGKVEYIGSLEQVYMEIAVDEKESYPGVTTHLELAKTDFMSNLANLIPMPDLNQSPRNMYQCQMGKQTMGTPCLNWPKQAANKLYRLQTPGTPLFRPVHHDNIGLDDFAMGTNAIVAVISYTGYDMEDAMIINKSAHERGFAYGSIIKSKFIELKGTSYFARDPNNETLASYLDNDGLPQAGTKLTHEDILYSFFDTEEFKYKIGYNDEKEDCVIDSVRFCGNFKTNAPRTICITIRVPRPPNIGDKFASRAGQKGICSQKYPAEDLPFSETGLIPDIVFNPHGFPSRMTIAMMVETMAGKSAALHGLVHDATPFRFTEKHTAIDYFGKLLEMGGYNYYGTERLYSGIDGREITADIFFGVVHYQRLRHMVFDKWQVRSTGAVDAVTQQPIKGRKRGGGVRFGEMERDALISHGCAFLLQDRLFHNSDKSNALVCDKCGSILAPMKRVSKKAENGLEVSPETCRLCGDGKGVGNIELPFSYKYLVSELTSVNINARFKLTHI
ncbi:DNA-directed RNA polymerase I subunit RPA2 [Episyrphus balteatus]|uniref:DNA-directed RNA polymerase I subunit RPA2 n=1 Tax=Episyrphus balteatus TaxID=286459 RepID=UPI002484F582|nr:DNA-directed RNA polymerase I subunit RPA2 [Episyrphus balteatus]